MPKKNPATSKRKRTTKTNSNYANDPNYTYLLCSAMLEARERGTKHIARVIVRYGHDHPKVDEACKRQLQLEEAIGRSFC